MQSAGKIPATVVTGFLGAGKTSLIQSLLRRANGRRLALIINEFGSLGVDGELLKACGDDACSEEDIVELANGCICCTVADDFLPTMQALLDRPVPPDHIVIETSGLALPKPLLRAFNWPEVRSRVTVDGVIAVVDGRAVADGQFADDPAAVQAQREADDMLDHDSPLEELLHDQLACADLAIINKCDLLDDAEATDVRRQIQAETRPATRILSSVNGALDPAVLLGMAVAAEDDLDSRPSHHDGTDDHEHDDFESFVVELDPVDDTGTLSARLQRVLADHDVLRIKGFAAVSGRDMRLAVQAVGPRVQTYFDRDWTTPERLGRLVVIGAAGLDARAISAALRGQ